MEGFVLMAMIDVLKWDAALRVLAYHYLDWELLITVFPFGHLPLVFWIWSVVEIITVNDDVSGRSLV